MRAAFFQKRKIATESVVEYMLLDCCHNYLAGDIILPEARLRSLCVSGGEAAVLRALVLIASIK